MRRAVNRMDSICKYAMWLCLAPVIAIAASMAVPRFYTGTDNTPLTGSETVSKIGTGILWLTSPSNNTFNGNVVVERGGGTLMIGGNSIFPAGAPRAGLVLPNMVGTNSFTVRPGGTLYLNENGAGVTGVFPGRLGQPGNRPAVILDGGTLTHNGLNLAGYFCTQFVGQVSAAAGMNTLQVYRNSGTPVLCADGLTIADDAYVSLLGTTMGAANADVSKLFFDNPPTMVGGGGGDGNPTKSIIPAARFGYEFVTYGTYGVRALTAAEYYATANINGAGTTDNVKFNNATLTALSGDKTVNALALATAATWNMGSGKTLTLTSGQLLSSVAFTFAQGALTAGGGILNIVPAAGTINISGNINDNSGAVRLVKSGAGGLTLSATTDNGYSGGTAINEGSVSTSGTVADRRFFGSGPVLVDNASLTLTSVGATAYSGAYDYTVRNAGQINIANLAYGASDTFNIESNSVIYGLSAAGTGLNSLERNVNVTLAPGAIVGHNQITTLLDRNIHTIRSLGTAGDLFYGLGSNQDDPAGVVVIGAGTPFKGVSSDRANRNFNRGTIRLAPGTADFELQGLQVLSPALYPVPTPAYLYFGNLSVAGGPVIDLNGNGAVTAHLRGYIYLADDNAVYGNTGNGDTLEFAVESDAYLYGYTANCMGSGNGIASITVKSGGTLTTFNMPERKCNAAFNGTVTVEAGGRFVALDPLGLSGTGQLVFKSGAIVEIQNASAFSGPQAASATIEPGVIFRVQVASFGTASDTLNAYLHDKSPIIELFGGNKGAYNPNVAGTTVLTLNRANDGRGGMLTADGLDRAMSTAANGMMAVGANGGTIAATKYTTLTVYQPLRLGANELTIGDTNILDWVSEPKLGNVTLASGADYSTADSGSRITVLSGIELRNSANSLPNKAEIKADGVFYVAGADIIGALSGTGLVSVATALTVGDNDSNATFSGRLDGASTFTKRGSGRQEITGGSNGFSGPVRVAGGELALSGQGKLGNNGASAFTVASGGTLHLDNSSVNLGDRLTGASPTVIFNGGAFKFSGKDGAAASETVGGAVFAGGESAIEVNNGSGAGSSAELTFASFGSNPSGTVNFKANNGTLGMAGDNPRVKFTGLTAGLIPAGRVGADLATYDTTYGVRAFKVTDGVEFDGTNVQTTLNTVFTTANLSPNLNAARTVNSLWISSPGSGKAIDFGPWGFTITSGRILLSGSDDFTITRNGNGVLSCTPTYLMIGVDEKNTTLTLAVPTGKAVAKDGAGTLLLDAPFTFTGGLVINNGTVKYGANGDLAITPVTIWGGGIWDLAGKTNDTIGALTIYEGGVTNSDINNASVLTVSSIAIGSGTAGSEPFIMLNAGDTLKLGGTLTYNILNEPGTARISGGALDLNGATRTFSIYDSPGAYIDLDISSCVKGAAGNGLTKGEAGIMRLSGTNTFDGDVGVTGALIASHPQALGQPGSARTITTSTSTLCLDGRKGNITVPSNYTLSLNGAGFAAFGPVTGALVSNGGTNTVPGTISMPGNPTIAALAGKLALNGSFSAAAVRAMTFQGDGDIEVNGILSATAVTTVTKNGNGTLILNAANAYAGNTVINGGVIRARHNTALGTAAAGTWAYDGAALELDGGISVADALNLSGAGPANGGALRNISGTNTLSGAITLAMSNVRINSDSGKLVVDVPSGNAIGGAAFTTIFGGSGDIAVADPIATTTGGITKDGSGTLTLGGVNTYTGPTVVEAGRIDVNGSTIAGSAVTVKSGAVLGGTGSVLGTATVQGGGTVAPGIRGNAGGTLTNATLNLEAGSRLVFEFATPAAYSKLLVSAANGLTIGANVEVLLYANGTLNPWTTPGTYNLVQYNGSFNGSISNITLANAVQDSIYTLFVEGGWIKVRIEAARVTALPVSNLTTNSARMNGILDDVAAENPRAWFCWDAADRGINSTGNWAHVDYVGTVAKGESFSNLVAGLVSGSNYTYRCYVENSMGGAWSAEAVSFKPVYLPAVTNIGARVVSPGVALLQGAVTDTGSETPRVWFHYWKVGDPVTNILSAGYQGGACDITANGLALAATYQYKLSASNLAGQVWSGVKSFTSASGYYVSPAGNNSNDGLSWTAALKTIDAALALAHEGDAIHLVGGTHLTAAQINWSVSGLNILGGYAGNDVGGLPGERDWRRWKTTVMSDGMTPHRIFNISGVNFALLEGVTVTGGETDNENAGAGLRIIASSNVTVNATLFDNNKVIATNGMPKGVGACVTNSTVIFTNTVFRRNSVEPAAVNSRGGGAAVLGGAVTFSECLFDANELYATGAQQVYGGGLYIEGGAHRIEHSAFVNNRTMCATVANARGDGLCVNGAATTVDAFNNLFSGNMRDAIHLENGTLAVSYATITTHGRYSLRRVAGNLTVSDSIIWQSYDPTSGVMTVSNCLVDADPRFERGLCLASGSPAIDGGSATAAAAGLAARATASDGTPDSGAADLGYHFSIAPDFSYADDAIRHDPARADLYVATDGDNGNDGSLSAPFRTITYTLTKAAAGTTVHIAAGEYGSATETFPLFLGKPGLRLAGSGAATTVINAGRLATSNRVLTAWGVTGDGRMSDITFAGGYIPKESSYLTLPYLPEYIRRLNRGGGLRLFNNSITFDGIAVTNCESQAGVNDNNFGGGICSVHTWAYMTNSLVARNALGGAQSNTGTGYGGGIYLFGGAWRIFDCDITGNTGGFSNYGGNYGGGIFMTGRHELLHSRVIGNKITGQGSSDRFGNGVAMENGLVSDCLIVSNTMTTTTKAADFGGGGVYMSGGALRNSLLAGNHSHKHGGAIYATGGLIESVTAAANTSELISTSAGAHLVGAAPIVSNSVFYANTRLFDNANVNISDSGGTVAYSCTLPLRAGDNNTDADPEFTDIFNYDFTPMTGSPVIDAAKPQAWMIGAKDINGNNRVRGSAPDMGAVEAPGANEGPLGVNFVADKVKGHDSLNVTFTAYPSGTDLSGIVYYWDLDGDGITDVVGSDKESVSRTYAPGYYTVALAVTNGALEDAAISKPSYIWVSASEIYVWSGGSGYPGTSWANAFTNVQQAIDFADGSNNIYLAGEIFDLPGELTLADRENVSICGGYKAGVETFGPGPYDTTQWPTVLRRPPASSRIFYIAFVSNAKLSRVTVTGGYYYHAVKPIGGGINIFSSQMEISDCVISNNMAYGGHDSYSWGGGLYVNNSTLAISRTLFATNTSKTWAANYNGNGRGGALATENSTVTVFDCRFQDNLADSNCHQGSWGGALYTLGGSVLVRNSLFAGNMVSINHVRSQGGAAYVNAGTVLENCTFVANTSRNDGGTYTTSAGGVYAIGAYITNCIVAYNTNTYASAVSDLYSDNFNRVAYSCATEVNDGVNGNIISNPLLRMEAGKWPRYSLGDGSPCINSGIRLLWMETATDLAGNKRVSGGAADMGCYERPAAAATMLFLR